MRILITNDDGVDAPGIKVMQQIAAELSDDVWVVAPDVVPPTTPPLNLRYRPTAAHCLRADVATSHP